MSKWYDEFSETELIEARHEIRKHLGIAEYDYGLKHAKAIDHLMDNVLVKYIQSVHAYHQAKPIQKVRYGLHVSQMKSHHTKLYGENTCKCGYCKND